MESQAKLQRVSSYATGLGKVSPTEIPHVRSTDEKYIRDCYEFGRELGKGSFGVVWEIQHRETKERFACKIIAKDKVKDQRVKLISREVGILKSVNHENIIQLKQVFETSQKIYLVMELCEGGELSRLLRLRAAPFNEDECRHVMQQLTSAISYLHRNGMVHRDLKLENILLSTVISSDHVDMLHIKVTDFGLSIVKAGVGADKMMDEFCGTPMYMAPEISDFKTYSEKCDIWAMGVILFKLLTGSDAELIIEAKKPIDMRAKLDDLQFRRISDAAKDCLAGMLQWDPAYRLTASEILQHPWIRGQNCLDMTDRRLNVLEMMKEFHAERLNGMPDEHDGGPCAVNGSVSSKSSTPVKTNKSSISSSSSASLVSSSSRSSLANKRVSQPMTKSGAIYSSSSASLNRLVVKEGRPMSDPKPFVKSSSRTALSPTDSSSAKSRSSIHTPLNDYKSPLTKTASSSALPVHTRQKSS